MRIERKLHLDSDDKPNARTNLLPVFQSPQCADCELRLNFVAKKEPMMGKIFYSVAGEGRGHAIRVRTIVEELRDEHEIVLFAPHVAFEFLNELYQDARDVQVRRIPGLQFCYKNRRVSYFKSIHQSIPYLRGLPELVNSMERMLRNEQPDLIITDFEPALPRAVWVCRS